MTTKMTATQVKARILALLDRVAAGEEIEITKRGQTVARLVPARGAQALRGSQTGVAMTNAEEHGLFSTDEVWNLE